ncbi:MAG: acetyl-CoA C-acyltransferase [Rhodospirillaceae bacterium]|nr:acetyl-CoA C-acyltransferase [Rhodospirillaceae bacterium]
MADSLWLAAGLRTPFAKVDGPLAGRDAISLSVPVVQAMCGKLKKDDKPDLIVWGTVAPSLRWSNIAREVALDAGLDPYIPAFTSVMACATSMVGVFAAADTIRKTPGGLALVGGSESMSGVQIGLNQKFSVWLRRFFQAKSLNARAEMLGELPYKDVRLHIPSITNRTTGLSMGEGTEIMAKAWSITREAQDKLALASHRDSVKAWERGFFDDLVIPLDGLTKDPIPRADTSPEKLAKLKPSFDATSGRGSLTAGNSSPLTDGASSIWLADEAGLDRLPSATPRVRLLDWDMAGVDILRDGLLMAPAVAIPRLLARNNLAYDGVALWEIHEAFSAQVLVHVAAMEDKTWLATRAGVTAALGRFPWDRLNPNGGSVALGHPFGATGARILSQAVKELAAMPPKSLAVVSICTDGGLGAVCLLSST